MSRKQALAIESVDDGDCALSHRYSRHEAVAAEAGGVTSPPDPNRSGARGAEREHRNPADGRTPDDPRLRRWSL